MLHLEIHKKIKTKKKKKNIEKKAYKHTNPRNLKMTNKTMCAFNIKQKKCDNMHRQNNVNWNK